MGNRNKYLEEGESELIRKIQDPDIGKTKFEELASRLIEDFNWGPKKVETIRKQQSFDGEDPNSTLNEVFDE